MELPEFFEKFIVGIPAGNPVPLAVFHLGKLPYSFVDALRMRGLYFLPDVVLSSWSLKHAYDRRPHLAPLLINFLPSLVIDPKIVVLHPRGKLLLGGMVNYAGKIKLLVAPLELDRHGSGRLAMVTFFPARPSYFEKYDVLWRGG